MYSNVSGKCEVRGASFSPELGCFCFDGVDLSNGWYLEGFSPCSSWSPLWGVHPGWTWRKDLHEPGVLSGRTLGSSLSVQNPVLRTRESRSSSRLRKPLQLAMAGYTFVIVFGVHSRALAYKMSQFSQDPRFLAAKQGSCWMSNCWLVTGRSTTIHGIFRSSEDILIRIPKKL